MKKRILKLWNEMVPELKKTGLKRFDEPILDTDDEFILQDALNWLEDIRWGAYQEVLNLWAAHPEDVWEYFKEMKETSLQEIRQLRAKQRGLKRAWMDKDRPPILFKPPAGLKKHGNAQRLSKSEKNDSSHAEAVGDAPSCDSETKC